MPEVVRTVGRYGVLRELGRGGMAVVYLARQVDLDRLVALKELAAFHAADPDFARRFVRESRLAGSLVHPNVITVFDYFEHDGTPYIAMEYVDRGSLRPYVGRMTIAQIGGVLEGVLAGLAEAERHNIVHRDLKPENLMVTSTGTVKIADFGIAKATQVADTGAFVTATGTTVGTPPYMAPEQAMAKDVGAWTDLYSVGCMAYELFTGKPPFSETEEALAILLRHISEALPPASEVAGVDPDISAWIERLTAKEPSARPESATAAWEELEEILIGKLGPRWRREARLPEPPNRAAESGPLAGDSASGRARAADGGDRRRGNRPGHGRRHARHRDAGGRGTQIRDLSATSHRAAVDGGHRRRGDRPGYGATWPTPRRRPNRRPRAAAAACGRATRRRASGPTSRSADRAAGPGARGDPAAAGGPPAGRAAAAARGRRPAGPAPGHAARARGSPRVARRAVDPPPGRVARALERVRRPVPVRGDRCGPGRLDRRERTRHGAPRRIHRRRCADRVRQPDAGRLAGASPIHDPAPRRAVDAAGRRRPPRCGRRARRRPRLPAVRLAQGSRCGARPGAARARPRGSGARRRGDVRQLRRLQLAVERAGRRRQRGVRGGAGDSWSRRSSPAWRCWARGHGSPEACCSRSVRRHHCTTSG